MAEGPGGREVGRVSLRVLPDTSNFLPSLRRYAERVERTVSVSLGVSIDSSGLEQEARRLSERVERTVPTIRIPTTPDAEGFAAEAARQVRVASSAIEANIPVSPDTDGFVAEMDRQVRLASERVEANIPVSPDVEGFAADMARQVRAASERVERTVPTIRIPTLPDTDGFAREMARQVRAASAAIQANIPLTADGERMRRSILAEVALLEAQIQQLELEVPLDVEDATRARAELRARIAGLQILADANAVQVPVTVTPNIAPGFGGQQGAVIGAIGALTALLGGGLIASLPALMASIAAPVAAIALGFQGIAAAALIAQPAFDAMRQALSNTFLTELAPVFATLAEVLPRITPEMQAIATALSTGFGAIVTQIASPEGLAALEGILTGIATAMTILAPALAPMTQLFLDIALIGMQAFVENAPALLMALQAVTDLFTYLNDSGVIRLAVQGFTAFVIGASFIAGAVAGILVAIGAGLGAIVNFGVGVARVISSVIGWFSRLVVSVAGSIAGAVSTISTLPARARAALGDLGSMLFGSGAALIGGFVRGMLSMLWYVIQAASTIANTVAAFFPGSPVKTGPLTSWNGGGAGKSLGEMLAGGLEASKSTVAAASTQLASAVAVPTAAYVGAGVAAAPTGVAGMDPYVFSDIITDAMRQTPLQVNPRETARAQSQVRSVRNRR